MNKNLLILFYICSFHVFIAQQRSKSEKLYDKGNAAVKIKDYRTADSLFTLSLNLVPHPNGYYNRAVCRRQLNDFKGYCIDLLEANNLGDDEAKGLYCKQCTKVDTVYKKYDGEIATKTNYETVEYTTSYKYNSNFEYEKWNQSKKIILSKIRVGNVVTYRKSSEVVSPIFSMSNDSLLKKIKTETDFSAIVLKNNLVSYSSLTLLIDENGKIYDLKLKEGENDKAIAEIIKVLSNSTNCVPATYNLRAVKYKAELNVLYYENELTLTSELFFKNKLVDSLELVEEMPEFLNEPNEMMRFVAAKVNYPQRAKEEGISGKCILRFVILPNGKISNVELVRGIAGCPECDNEAIRVIKTMQPWEPGMQNGLRVPVKITIPVHFTLK
jgi:TonB family protein